MSLQRKYFTLLFFILLLFISVNCSQSQQPADKKGTDYPFEAPSDTVLNPFKQNTVLGRGVNMGNALEAPNEGDWGVTIKDEYFPVIKAAGFNSVRIPIRWSAHAAADSPFTLDATFLKRVDHVLDQALQSGLAVIINIHHYQELMDNPASQKQRFLALWQQIAVHYKNYPDRLFMEILNEPNNKLTAELWNSYFSEALSVIRQSNPYRTLIIGTAEWGGIGALEKLQIPDQEQNVIVTFHYYNPFHFTHQGAEWVDGSNAWLGTTWSGTPDQKNALISDFAKVFTWSQSHNRPVFMGEFGAYSKADISSRVAWTTYVRRQAENWHWSWAYWEFCSGFGVYDPNNNVWYEDLLKALIPIPAK